ncbi:unnamed protein product [Soboliphyme baturini]|uniref:Uncharacterized protein n=1 Tax=Soboliphyme baturini TaxID=241478 RepID=A0A183IJ65_9BILA|nr:unnamed protein product [Soboliphyme baturini]
MGALPWKGLRDAQEVRLSAAEYIKRKLPLILRAFNEAESFVKSELGDLSSQSLHTLLLYIRSQKSENLEALKQSFRKSLRRAFLVTKAPIAFLPLLRPSRDLIICDALSDNETVMDSAKKATIPLAQQIREIGYGFCVDAEACRRTLTSLGIAEITPSALAQVLCMMLRTNGFTLEGTSMAEVSEF